jgi:hypothetical protein
MYLACAGLRKAGVADWAYILKKGTPGRTAIQREQGMAIAQGQLAPLHGMARGTRDAVRASRMPDSQKRAA